MPKIAGVDWERHPRGRYRVLLCPGRRILDPHQRCPFSVIIANPGGEVDEAAAVKAATEHYEQHHGGTWSDEWRLTTGGAPSAPLVDEYARDRAAHGIRRRSEGAREGGRAAEGHIDEDF